MNQERAIWVVITTKHGVLLYPPELFGLAAVATREVRRWLRAIGEMVEGSLQLISPGHWRLAELETWLMPSDTAGGISDPWVGIEWVTNGSDSDATYPLIHVLRNRRDAIKWLSSIAGDDTVLMELDEWSYEIQREGTSPSIHLAKVVDRRLD